MSNQPETLRDSMGGGAGGVSAGTATPGLLMVHSLGQPACVPLSVGEVTSVTGGHIQVQPFVDFSRLEKIRLIDYSLPGILMQDLGVDTTKALSPNKQTGLLSPEAGE